MMALDRWIALVILLLCCAYGYAAFFVMDGLLKPFERFSAVWPSSFPKVIAVLGMISALIVLLGVEKSDNSAKAGDIDYRRLHEYKLGQALLLIGMMVAYALLLRPIGFIAATFLFLTISSFVLGERNFPVVILVSLGAAFGVWSLVQSVLGIYLSPWPSVTVQALFGFRG